MGNRVSIRFVNKEDVDSPVIFCHWGGMGFVGSALKYVDDLVAERSGHFDPLDRLEPRTVTCDFLYNIEEYYPINLRNTTDHRIAHDIYMGLDENDGDNGDNGHFDIDLANIEARDALKATLADYFGV